MQPGVQTTGYSPEVLDKARALLKELVGFEGTTRAEFRDQITQRFGVDEIVADAIYDLIWVDEGSSDHET